MKTILVIDQDRNNWKFWKRDLLKLLPEGTEIIFRDQKNTIRYYLENNARSVNVIIMDVYNPQLEDSQVFYNAYILPREIPSILFSFNPYQKNDWEKVLAKISKHPEESVLNLADSIKKHWR